MRIAISACLAGVCALFAQGAQAQDGAAEASTELSTSAEAAPEAAPEEAVAEEAEPAAKEDVEDEAEDKHDPMNSIGIGFKLGLGMNLGQDFASVSTTGAVAGGGKQNDVGLALGIPIYFGDGHGFGTDLEIFHWRTKEAGFTVAYTGLQTAFGGRFQVADPVYMFIGLGPRLGVVHGDADVGLHAALRLPVQATWYPIDMLGIVGELGLGYGVTARTTGGGNEATGIRGFLLDLTVGVRFP